MKVLVVSDSHGDSGTIRNLVDRYKHEVETVIHLGDNARDLIRFDADYPEINFVAVAGNCDYGTSLLSERILTIGTTQKRRVLLLHGHSLNVKSNLNRLMYYAQEKNVDACLYGHSHMPFLHVDEPVFTPVGNSNAISACIHSKAVRPLFIMNPGSTSEPRGGSVASYGILSIDDEGNITGEIIKL